MITLAGVHYSYPDTEEEVLTGIDFLTYEENMCLWWGQCGGTAKMATRLKLNYPSMVGDLEAMDIARRLGNTAGVLPYTVLIGADGKVLARLEGRADAADLETWLKTAVDSHKPPR